MWRTVTTARDVVDVLGGNAIVAKMTGGSIKSVYHWKGTAKKFPARHYDAMQRELKKRRVIAPPRLWNQAEGAIKR
jgi:hypothetical protein